MQSDDRLAKCGRVARIEGGVPLPVFIAEANHRQIGARDLGTVTNCVHLGALVILPEGGILIAQYIDAAIVAGGVIGHRR